MKQVTGLVRWLFLKKKETDFAKVDGFDDKTYRNKKGFGSTGLNQQWLKKMPVEITRMNDSVNFSMMTLEEKEEFCNNIITK